MRFVRYQIGDSQPRYGWYYEDAIGPIEGSPFGDYRRLEAVLPLESVRLLPPVQPSKIICVGRNYIDHAREHGVEVPEIPLLFLKPPSALIGHLDAIILPPQSSRVEHEAELGVVIGKPGRWIQPERVNDHIFGYTIANDVTARDLQRQDRTWTRGKGFDTFCPAGPWLVTGLREEDIADLSVVCRVNGAVRQQGRTSEMVFSPSELIAYASTIMTLEPGDLLLTGTPAGVGPLHPGDHVQVDIETIGTLHNPVQ